MTPNYNSTSQLFLQLEHSPLGNRSATQMNGSQTLSDNPGTCGGNLNQKLKCVTTHSIRPNIPSRTRRATSPQDSARLGLPVRAEAQHSHTPRTTVKRGAHDRAVDRPCSQKRQNLFRHREGRRWGCPDLRSRLVPHTTEGLRSLAKPLPERVTDPHRQRGAGEVRETVFSDDAAGES